MPITYKKIDLFGNELVCFVENKPTKNDSQSIQLSYLVEGEGFEPSKAEPSDLQSDPFGRSGTPPSETANYEYFTAISQSDSNTVL